MKFKGNNEALKVLEATKRGYEDIFIRHKSSGLEGFADINPHDDSIIRCFWGNPDGSDDCSCSFEEFNRLFDFVEARNLYIL